VPRYGTRLYADATFIYGAGGLASLNVAPFTATAVDYTEVDLSWLSPVGAYSRMRLVRNQIGVPDTSEDGVILIDEQVAQTTRAPRYFTDSVSTATDPTTYVPLTPGKFTYYSIWLFLISDQEWFQVGDVTVLIAGKHETQLSAVEGSGVMLGRTRNTHEKLMDLLPRVFTSDSNGTLDEVDPNSDLSNFLYGFSYTIDEVLTYIDLLQPRHDASNYSPELLSVKAYELDALVQNRPSTRYLRRLVREAQYIYSHKGTASGLSTYLEALTGYNATVATSPNLFLSNQDSTFRDWSSYSQSVASNTANITGASSNGTYATYTAPNQFLLGQVVTVTGVTPSSYNSSSAVIVRRTNSQFTLETTVPNGTAWSSGGTAQVFENSTHSFWRVLGAGTLTADNTTLPTTSEPNSVDTQFVGKLVTSSADVSLNIGNENPVTQGIPVITGNPYTLSFYHKTAATSTVTYSLKWYDRSGVFISTGTGTFSASSTWTKQSMSATAPAGAVYLGITLSFSAAGTYYLDLFQVSRQFAITAATGDGATVTYTCSNSVTTVTSNGSVVTPALSVGDRVSVTGLGTGSGTSLNLADVIVTSATTSQFTVRNTTVGVASGTGAVNHNYYEARGAIARLAPTKENLIYNPSFEGADAVAALTSWTVGQSVTKTKVTIGANTPGPSATDAGLAYVTMGRYVGDNTLTAEIDEKDVSIGQFYTFSMYAKSSGLGTATMTIAAPGVVTCAAHGLTTGDVVYFTTTGALPTGVTTAGRYYAIVVTSSTFRLATSAANATAGTAITTAGTQSGVHTVYSAEAANVAMSLTATSTGSISGAVGNGTSVTYTSSGRVYVGDKVTVSGMTPSGYNSAETTVIAATATTFTIAGSHTGAFSSGGAYTLRAQADRQYRNSTTISNVQAAGGVVTYTIDPAPFGVPPIGASVVVSSVTPSGYNLDGVATPVLSTTGNSFSVLATATGTYVSGGTVTWAAAPRLTSEWYRFQVSLYLPTNFTNLTLTPVFTFDNTELVSVDLAQLEPRFSASDYFDGSYADANWKYGTANNSPSHLYQNEQKKLPQVITNIESVLPSNTAYQVELVSGIAELLSGQKLKGFTS
jgi:phage tail-like protein